MAPRVLHAACVAAIAASTVAGCASDEAPPAGAPPVHAAVDGNAALTAPASVVEAAIADAMQRTGRARDAIHVLVAQAVIWRDGSLGCPSPDRMYTDALVSGHRVVLRVGAETLNYHSGPRGQPVFCPADRVVAPMSGATDPSV